VRFCNPKEAATIRSTKGIPNHEGCLWIVLKVLYGLCEKIDM
jgi:hypothetical protein